MSEYNEKYHLPAEIIAEPKIMKFVPIRMLLVVIIFVFVGMRFQDMVYDSLHIPFLIYNIIVGILLSLPSPINLQKRIYQTALINIFADKKLYKPISNPNKMPVTVKQYERYEGRVTYVEPDE